MKVQFNYRGGNTEAILNRLPTARILSEVDGVQLIEAEVYGKGILMWLLSQGDMIEVIKPKELREEMKEMLRRMMDLYQD